MRGHGLPKRTTPPEQLGPALLGALISLVVPTVQAILRGFQRGELPRLGRLAITTDRPAGPIALGVSTLDPQAEPMSPPNISPPPGPAPRSENEPSPD
ncbi:hypothetical protein K8Z49_48090 [Actinomadura madurae]|uniref:hypothetical protein n=1 Tax=Actinomadura madurae TaxID=1993 RepID=UPI00399B7536